MRWDPKEKKIIAGAVGDQYLSREFVGFFVICMIFNIRIDQNKGKK